MKTKISYQPKHVRLNEIHKDINTFYRRKYINNNKLFHNEKSI